MTLPAAASGGRELVSVASVVGLRQARGHRALRSGARRGDWRRQPGAACDGCMHDSDSSSGAISSKSAPLAIHFL
eukprot:COSAG05_NODE_416_length_10031_cov_18.951067_12_plen_75_part_00